MAKKISEELYQAYLEWHKIEERATGAYMAYQELCNKHLGAEKGDSIEQGRITVECASRRLKENGASFNGRTPGSDPVNEGSNPSAPTEVEEEISNEQQENNTEGSERGSDGSTKSSNGTRRSKSTKVGKSTGKDKKRGNRRKTSTTGSNGDTKQSSRPST